MRKTGYVTQAMIDRYGSYRNALAMLNSGAAVFETGIPAWFASKGLGPDGRQINERKVA